METAERVWVAVRRDHDGNLDVLKMPDGTSFAWDLTEAEADAVIVHVQRVHLKPHGQSYWKLNYPRGHRSAFLRLEKIRF